MYAQQKDDWSGEQHGADLHDGSDGAGFCLSRYAITAAQLLQQRQFQPCEIGTSDSSS